MSTLSRALGLLWALGLGCRSASPVDETPGRTLERLEERFATARSLRATFRVRIEGFAEFLGHEKGLTDSCTLLLKQGNKAVVTCGRDLPPRPSASRMQFVSDGAKLVLRDEPPVDVPSNLRDGLATLLTRASVHGWLMT